jgi:hypothetical protein
MTPPNEPPGKLTPVERAQNLLRGHADNLRVKPFGLLLLNEIAAAITEAVNEKLEAAARIADGFNVPVAYTDPDYDVNCGKSMAGEQIAAGIRALKEPPRG